jgi:hypothetical protein
MKSAKIADIHVPSHRPYKRVRLDWRVLGQWAGSQRARNQAAA